MERKEKSINKRKTNKVAADYTRSNPILMATFEFENWAHLVKKVLKLGLKIKKKVIKAWRSSAHSDQIIFFGWFFFFFAFYFVFEKEI